MRKEMVLGRVKRDDQVKDHAGVRQVIWRGWGEAGDARGSETPSGLE